MYPIPIFLDANTVSAVSAAAAAIAAFLTVLVTVSHWDEARRDRKVEQRAEFANEWIVRRVNGAVDQFLEVVAPRVAEKMQAIHKAHADNGAVSAIDALIATLIDEVAAEYIRLRRVIVVRVRGTLRDSGVDAVVGALDALEDRFTASLDHAPRKIDADVVMAELEGGCANLLRTVVAQSVELA
jgi:hypothetical protein